MDEISFLKKIETNYPVQQIKVQGYEIWPFLRIKLAEEYRATHKGVKSRSLEINRVNIKVLVRSIFYGLFNWLKLKRVQTLIFSSSERRKRIGKYYHDRVTEGLNEIVDSPMQIESPFPLNRHYKLDLIPHKNIISEALFFALTKFINILHRKPEVTNSDIFEGICEQYGLIININQIALKFHGQYVLMKYLLKYIFPELKRAFFAYSGSSMGYILALKEKGIEVIELQHGIITSKHRTFNVFNNTGKDLRPDYLFTYGDYVAKIFNKENYFIDSQNVKAVGYYFLEKQRFMEVSTTLKSKYPYDPENILVYSFQEPYESVILPFLMDLAKSLTSLQIIISPRHDLSIFEKYDMPGNIIIEADYSIYELLKIARYHATINSTTAIEAKSFNCINLLYNYKNSAFDYFVDIFDKSDLSVFYLNQPSEFIDVIQQTKLKEIEINNKDYFKENFSENVKKLIQ